jgi:3-hydroxyacyl-CoA dehydrogenase
MVWDVCTQPKGRRMSNLVHYSVEDGIAVLTVDNPPVNALGHGVRTGLKEGIERAIADEDADTIVLICAGRTFFAGADISEFGKPPVSPTLREVHEVMEACPKALTGGLSTVRTAMPSSTE